MDLGEALDALEALRNNYLNQHVIRSAIGEAIGLLQEAGRLPVTTEPSAACFRMAGLIDDAISILKKCLPSS